MGSPSSYAWAPHWNPPRMLFPRMHSSLQTWPPWTTIYSLDLITYTCSPQLIRAFTSSHNLHSKHWVYLECNLLDITKPCKISYWYSGFDSLFLVFAIWSCPWYFYCLHIAWSLLVFDLAFCLTFWTCFPGFFSKTSFCNCIHLLPASMTLFVKSDNMQYFWRIFLLFRNIIQNFSKQKYCSLLK